MRVVINELCLCNKLGLPLNNLLRLLLRLERHKLRLFLRMLSLLVSNLSHVPVSLFLHDVAVVVLLAIE